MAMNAIPSSQGWSHWGSGNAHNKPSSHQSARHRWSRAAVVGMGAGSAVGLALALSRPELGPLRTAAGDCIWETLVSAGRDCSISPLASLSLASAAEVQEVVEPRTGMTFPATLEESRIFTGTGLRKKSILGLKKITVYAYGVYADPVTVKSELGDKYGGTDPEGLNRNDEFFQDLMDKDVGLTVRLVIAYGNLKIGSVRSAFEESVGNRLKKFGSGADGDLLSRFTSAFTDDIMLPRGTTIDLIRLPGSVLQTKIDGTEVGSVQSSLLCRSLFDLYIGDDPFDKEAKKSIGLSLASLVVDQD